MSIKQRRSIIHNKVHNSFDKFKKSFIHKMLQIIRSVQNKVFLKTENININISKIILRVSLSKTRKNIYSKKNIYKTKFRFCHKINFSNFYFL